MSNRIETTCPDPGGAHGGGVGASDAAPGLIKDPISASLVSCREVGLGPHERKVVTERRRQK